MKCNGNEEREFEDDDDGIAQIFDDLIEIAQPAFRDEMMRDEMRADEQEQDNARNRLPEPAESGAFLILHDAFKRFNVPTLER